MPMDNKNNDNSIRSGRDPLLDNMLEMADRLAAAEKEEAEAFLRAAQLLKECDCALKRHLQARATLSKIRGEINQDK